MSNIQAKDGTDALVPLATHLIGGEHHGAFLPSDPGTGAPFKAADDATLAALNIIADAVRLAVESLNGKTPAAGPLTDTQLRASAIDVEPPPAVLSSYTQAGVIAINTVLLTLDCSQHRSVSVQCVSMGTTGVVTPEWSNDNAVWLTATMFTAAGASATTFNAAGLWRIPVMARYLRLRQSTATTAGTTTLSVHRFDSEMSPWLATQPVSLATNTPALAASTNRAGFLAGAGIWYDDTSTALGAGATFTGTSRDATLTATATAFANAATYAQEVVLSAEQDVSFTLALEVSRDNTNWRRVKAIPSAAVTGGGQYAEIVHRPSWRYWRLVVVNGAGAAARTTAGSIAKAI